MGFLDSLKSFFGDAGPKDEGYWIYVRCKRCGEVIKTRIDLQGSLSLQDDGGYVAHKTLVGSQLCFQRVEVTLRFDSQRNLTDRDIAFGEFITAAEYAQASGSTP